MLKLLLDEHISPRVARALRQRSHTLIVHSFSDWEGGALLGQSDSTCLQAASELGLTLVTYDRRTIPTLLKDWAEAGRDHGGVIFVDEKTISPSDIGGLVIALHQLAREQGSLRWTNRICFLRR